MRLRMTVRRHSLPETSIIWVVGSDPSPTIAELLESVNESIPIESEEWGFEDYVVELKGANGINYECLHYQQVCKVMKEEDEVIIRPLLSHDIKTRKRSGRHQISADGYRLYDGLAYGKTLVRALADRPGIRIPPRKKRRVTYHNSEDEDDQHEEGSIAALEEKPFSENGDSNKQLVLHADFEDFAADEDSEADLTSEASEEESDPGEDSGGSIGQEEDDDTQLDDNAAPLSADDKQTLEGIPDKATRVKIRKLHSAFPTSPMAVCNFILVGTRGDVGEAYEALAQGFVAVKPKSAIAEVSEGTKTLFVPKTRAKGKEISKALPKDDDLSEFEGLSDPESRSKAKGSSRTVFGRQNDGNIKNLSLPTIRSLADLEPADEDEKADGNHQGEEIDSKTKYYDQNGFPPGSIKGGKLSSFNPEAENGSSQSGFRRSTLPDGSQSVSSAVEQVVPSFLTSTPIIDQHEQEDEEGTEDSSEDSSDDSTTSSSGGSSNSDESDGEESNNEASNIEERDPESSDSDAHQHMDESSQGSLSDSSDIDSSSDSSSNGSAPEEASSKQSLRAVTSKLASSPFLVTATKPVAAKQAQPPPSKGILATQKRNQRRKNAHRLRRCQEKGILPQDTTASEFQRLGGINTTSSPEEALAALDKLRSLNSTPNEKEQVSNQQVAQADEFEKRRDKLLASFAASDSDAGEVAAEPVTALTQKQTAVASVTEVLSNAEITEPQRVVKDFSTSPGRLSGPLQSRVVEAIIPAQVAHTSPDLEVSAPEPPTPSSQPPSDLADSTPNTPERRAKLDIGAGRRLLFGALGVRVPKTKEDEDRIRSNLMENVRPVKAPRDVIPLIEDNDVDSVGEDREAWRQTINYRAVECVQEGVELSEPPFPFIQRWDPQQQNPWSKTRGKRKADQVDQANYNDDSRASKKRKQRKFKHSYQEEQEYLDESYEPSQEKDSISTNSDDLSESQKAMTDDSMMGKSQQLLSPIQTNVEDASQEQEDLPPLPENPASLPDLHDEEAQVGMTIAYKTLECSAETRWQPQMSVYRTAIVVAVEENGELHLTLAKRDRKATIHAEDSEDRIYNSFELESEDVEDDGMVYLMYNQLCEPKIVQEVPADLRNDDIIIPFVDDAFGDQELALSKNYAVPGDEEETIHQTQEPQFSHISETLLQSDPPDAKYVDDNATENPIQFDARVPELFDEDTIGSVPRSNTPGLGRFYNFDLVDQAQPLGEPKEDSNLMSPRVHGAPVMTTSVPANDLAVGADALPNAVSDEARHQISRLIKDAGFRSSVPSSVTRGIQPSSVETDGDVIFEKLLQVTQPRSIESHSPRFNGFGSSSPIRTLAASPNSIEKADEPSKSPASPVQSSWITVEEPPSLLRLPPQAKTPEPQNSQDWETDSEDGSSSPPAKSVLKRESIKQEPRKRVPIANAQVAWEQLPGTKSWTDSPGEMINIPSEPENGLHRDKEATGPDSKVSNELSVASQIADHGRQPDFDSDDSALFIADATPEPEVGLDGLISSSPVRDDREEFSSQITSDNGDIPSSDLEPEVEESRHRSKSLISARIEELLSSPTRQAPISNRSPGPQKVRSPKKEIEKASPQGFGSSDDEFPTIEEVLSQRPPNEEKKTAVDLVRSKRKDAESKPHKKLGRDGTSEASDISDYRSSQNHSSASQPRLPSNKASGVTSKKGRNSQQSASSQPFVPSSHQIINLTLSSSDVDPDELKEHEPIAVDTSDNDQLPSFRSYDLDDEPEEASYVVKTEGKKSTGNKVSTLPQKPFKMQNKRKQGSKYPLYK